MKNEQNTPKCGKKIVISLKTSGGELQPLGPPMRPNLMIQGAHAFVSDVRMPRGSVEAATPPRSPPRDTLDPPRGPWKNATPTMAIRVVEFSKRGYKIRKAFA